MVAEQNLKLIAPHLKLIAPHLKLIAPHVPIFVWMGVGVRKIPEDLQPPARPSSYSHVIIGLGLARQGGAGLYHLESISFSTSQLRFKEKC